MGICYIVGAAKTEKLHIDKKEGDIIIACDGGMDTLRHFGICADFWLGDMDSTAEKETGAGEIFPKEKDQTDLYLALEKGLKMGYQTFVIYGATGGRIDHTMANIAHLLYLAKRGARGYLIDDTQFVTAIYNDKMLFEKGEGTISVFAAEKQANHVWERGLKYTLEDANLTEEFPLGISNEFIGQRAEIEVKDGILWIVSGRENLAQII